jgi:hypothetical protein
VSPAVAVRTQEVTFVRLRHELFPGSIEAAERELLGFRILMMKLKRGSAYAVTAFFAVPATGFDQPPLAFQPSLSLIAIPGIAPPLSSIRLSVVVVSYRSLRRVVASERRAGDPELSSIQRSHLSVDDLLRRELSTALLTHQRAQWPRGVVARAMPGLEWQALEAETSPVQVPTLAVDNRVVAEG